MKRLISIFVAAFLLVGASAFAQETYSASPVNENTIVEPGACDSALADLYDYASTGLGYEPTPISKIIQVYGIAPGYELVPKGVILNFEESNVWFGQQQPFAPLLKWGFGGFRHETNGNTKLTGLIVPIGGTIANFQVMEGTMIPKAVPFEGAEETGALVITPGDPDNNHVWTYVYSTFTPENWDCSENSIFPQN